MLAGARPDLGPASRSADQPPRRFDGWLVLVALLFLPSVALFSQEIERSLARGLPLVRSDGLGYFAYLPSVIFDGDLDFENDFRALSGQRIQPRFSQRTETGKVQNVQPVGSAVCWLPFYLLGHVLAVQLEAAGYPFEADGRGLCYQLAVEIGTQVYVLLGLLALYRLLCRWFERPVAALATAGTFWGTFLLWYSAVAGSFSHGPSFFAAALVLLLCQRLRFAARPLLGLGAAVGLLVAIRPDAAVFGLFPLLALIRAVRAASAPRPGRFLAGAALMGAGFSMALLPQLAVWLVLYGRVADPRLSGSFFHWDSLPLLEVLYSTRRGLFTWTPLLAPAALGLLLLVRKDRAFALTSLATLAAAACLNAAAADWWGGGGFGARRFTACLPLFAAGLAATLELLIAHPRVLAAAAVAGFAGINLLGVQVVLQQGHRALESTVDLGDLARQRDQTLRGWAGSPAAWPVNWLFSLRYGLPPARFDTLWGVHLDHDFGGRLEFAAPHHARYLGRGWSEPSQTSGGRTVCWVLGDEATVLVDLRPVDRPALRPQALWLTLAQLPAPLRPGAVRARPLRLEILVNGRRAGGQLVEERFEFVTLQLGVPPDLWRMDGLNEVCLRFSGGRRLAARQHLAALASSPGGAGSLGLTEADLEILRGLEPLGRPIRAAVDQIDFR